MATTHRQMTRLVQRIGKSLERAKNGETPPPQTRRDAELGDYRALVEVCCYEYLLNTASKACCASCAAGKPCESGCSKHDHHHHHHDDENHEDGFTVADLVLSDDDLFGDVDLLVPEAMIGARRAPLARSLSVDAFARPGSPAFNPAAYLPPEHYLIVVHYGELRWSVVITGDKDADSIVKAWMKLMPGEGDRILGYSSSQLGTPKTYDLWEPGLIWRADYDPETEGWKQIDYD